MVNNNGEIILSGFRLVGKVVVMPNCPRWTVDMDRTICCHNLDSMYHDLATFVTSFFGMVLIVLGCSLYQLIY